MRKKRKKRRHSLTSKNNIKSIRYSFTNVEIISFKPLDEIQLRIFSNQIEDVINGYCSEPKYVVAKQLIVKLKEIICSVQYNAKTDCFLVTINEKYLD